MHSGMRGGPQCRCFSPMLDSQKRSVELQASSTSNSRSATCLFSKDRQAQRCTRLRPSCNCCPSAPGTAQQTSYPRRFKLLIGIPTPEAVEPVGRSRRGNEAVDEEFEVFGFKFEAVAADVRRQVVGEFPDARTVPRSCPEGATGESPGWNPGDHATQRPLCPERAPDRRAFPLAVLGCPVGAKDPAAQRGRGNSHCANRAVRVRLPEETRGDDHPRRFHEPPSQWLWIDSVR